ncbi:MAG TPA: hypothetical protein VF384_07305 [Planctomycetota bacterium]
MKHTSLAFSLALVLASGPELCAQDAVTLHSVTINASNNVVVVYSKNFATCAHMRFNNATCTQSGVLTHVQNHFCTSGTNVTITVPLSAFVAGFGPDVTVFMVHGNNPGVFSPCVTVECNGAYGTGCAGTFGIPVLDAVDDCPTSPGTLDLLLTNGPPGSLAVLGFGDQQFSFPIFGCELLIAPLLLTTVVAFDGSGASSFSVPLPPGLGNLSLTMQAFALDLGGPEGFSATNGLLARIH